MIKNMKKIVIAIMMVATASAIAQEKLPNFPNEASGLRQKITSEFVKRTPIREIKVDDALVENNSMQAEQYQVRATLGKRIAQEDTQKAGYSNPEGTLFLGMDEKGKGTFFKTSGVIGAWSDSIPCWKWLNLTSGAYKKVKYETQLSYQYPSYVDGVCYAVDNEGNFCDSIVAHGGWADAYAMGSDGDAGNLWQMAVPLQTVTYKDGTTENFMLLNKWTGYKAENCAIAAGGLPSGNSKDGLWPLTNAVNIQRTGISMDLINSKDEDGYCHYIFGSDSANYETHIQVPDITMPSGYRDSVVITRVAPIRMVTEYDKPQAPLYIKNITLALGADGYTAFKQDTLKVNNLHMEIQDMNGNVLASSDAGADKLSAMSYKAGKILTFDLKNESAYGEILDEGILVSDAFQLIITGFDPKDAWGIYSAESNIHESKTVIEYENEWVKVYAYDPYIMLNGIYPTWENYFDIKAFEEEGYKTGVHGDTIDINMVAVNSPFYKYKAHWAGEDLAAAEYFAFYSTFAPYDSISRYWNLDIRRPEYIQLGADYDYNVSGDDEDVITLWDYLRMFEMFIYATDTPQFGDIITVGKAGRQTVFRIVAINGATEAIIDRLDEASNDAKNGIKKVIKNNMVCILRNGNVYNMQGQKMQ